LLQKALPFSLPQAPITAVGQRPTGVVRIEDNSDRSLVRSFVPN
jgi:hypothetical protein